MRTYHRTAAAIVVTALTVTTATACGSDSGDGTSLELGMSLSTLNNPFFVEMKKGAEAEAKKRGAKLTVSDARNDAANQTNHLQNFTTQRKDAIIVNPVDSDAAGPAVKAAGNADIPVLAADRGVNDAELVSTVASNNVRGGQLAARTLAKELDEKGSIVVLRGQTGTSASRERYRGFTEGMAEFPGIEVVGKQSAEFDRAKGMNVMTNMLQSHPDVDGVFAENDEMALGAAKALGKRAGSSVEVVGFDGTPSGIEAVRQGDLTATVAQQPSKLGSMAVRQAVRAAGGKDVRRQVDVPVRVATERNADEFP